MIDPSSKRLFTMNCQIECDQFNIQHVEDQLPVTEIKSEHDNEFEIKTEREEFEIEPIYQLVPFIKTEPEDIEYEIRRETEKCKIFPEHVAIKQEIEPGFQCHDCIETTSKVVGAQSVSDFLPDNEKKSHPEQLYSEKDETSVVPVVDESFEIHGTDLQKGKRVVDVCDNTSEMVKKFSLCKNSNCKFTNNYKKYSQISDARYKCDICQTLFLNKHQLTKHVYSIHNGAEQYTCDSCSKSFSSKSMLNAHARSHEKEKPFPCNFCRKTFSKKCGLVIHIKTHKRPFSCDICSQTFRTKDLLTEHQRIHTGVESFRCSVCNKSFLNQPAVYQHNVFHHKEKQFSCSFCSKSFCRNPDLTRHLRTHTKEKPFSCSTCKKVFGDRSNLIRHSRIHK